jgi:hypothetical protein
MSAVVLQVHLLHCMAQRGDWSGKDLGKARVEMIGQDGIQQAFMGPAAELEKLKQREEGDEFFSRLGAKFFELDSGNPYLVTRWQDVV